MSQQEPDPTNPVSESYEELFREVGQKTDAWTREKEVAKIQVKMVWEMTEALKEFSQATQRLSWVNITLTAVIAVATAVYALVAYFTYVK